ncbi:MAG TPA: phosphohistidine phosphatase SixA, partial [Candidatus Sulfotelmatobacter sp.]|nr:phosphohistidine phosphatase SixA [Candidatus Sulfotelmatobacter sp.]
MNLYLLRHGLAEERGQAGAAPDAERRLTPKGQRKLGQVAQGMEALGLSYDLILSSPYVRAWQTAELVAAACHARKQLRQCDALMPGGSTKALIGWLQRYAPPPEEVLLVGHEPDLSQLIGLLVAGSLRSRAVTLVRAHSSSSTTRTCSGAIHASL